mgnify:CR=1 FL=1
MLVFAYNNLILDLRKLIIIFSLSISNLKADFWAPLFRVSYDFNLGYTTSIGISWNNTESGDIGAGAYFLYSFSHKKGRKNVEGKNFSTGLYTGLGIASFRVGINNMFIKRTNNSSSRGDINRFRISFISWSFACFSASLI